jgi:agmatine deiminase
MATKTPAALGYRAPAEWEPHEATWLAWPHNEEDWPGKLGPIPWVYVEYVRRLARGERVRIIVQSERVETRARHALSKGGVDLAKVDFLRWPTDRGWMRDTAPSFVVGPKGIAAIDWRFNGWAKYENHLRDDKVPSRIARWQKIRRFVPAFGEARVVLEGGAIDLDGEGTLLTTEECLLDTVQQRNPGMSRADYERTFAEQLGIRKVLWLGRGIAGDDTHGHVDDLARFVRPGVVVVAHEPRADDENHRPLADNLERLREMTDASGRKLEVVTLPMPEPVVFDGMRLPASYANFYIANEQVFVPTFDDPHDRVALGTLAELFPDRTVVGIHALDLVWGLGTLHCASHEEPKAPG